MTKLNTRSLVIKTLCLKEFLGAIIFFGAGLNWLGVSKFIDAIKHPDTNFDGVFTISDLGNHLYEIFFANGNTFVSWLASTSYGTFFEMTEGNPNIYFSGLISFIGWGILIWGIIYSTQIMPDELEHEIER
jgi:hypothetical protein